MNKKEIISYHDVVVEEGFNIQKGMNYRPKEKNYSIFLMSTSDNSPYNDGFDKDEKFLHYEGEDISKREVNLPKMNDQAMFTKNESLTNNGKFFKRVESYKLGRIEEPENIRVYEKIDANIWSDKGWFELIDVIFKESEHENRKVFSFILRPRDADKDLPSNEAKEFEFSRRIPTEVKQQVWERDNGKCVECGAKEDLHFDHKIPWSKGGSSRIAENIQILCAKHNLSKSDKII